MYRGDDIYLLDWWPLDNQNTIGGGASYDFKKTDTRVAAHVGMQRLDDPYQYQVTQVTFALRHRLHRRRVAQPAALASRR